MFTAVESILVIPFWAKASVHNSQFQMLLSESQETALLGTITVFVIHEKHLILRI